MTDIEKYDDHQEETLIDVLKNVEEVGLLYVKGYNMHEIASLMSSTPDKVRDQIDEYKKILNRQADEDNSIRLKH